VSAPNTTSRRTSAQMSPACSRSSGSRIRGTTFLPVRSSFGATSLNSQPQQARGLTADPVHDFRRRRPAQGSVSSAITHGDASSSWWGFGRRQSVALAIATVAIFVWLARDLPRIPLLAPDSESYIEFSPVRPHGYSLFLAAYRLVFEDLAHLPSVQLALYLAAVFLLGAGVGLRARSLPAAAATLFLVCGLTDTSDFQSVLSDTIYAATLAAATACVVLYAESLGICWLLLASTGLGAALAFRPIGLTLLPGFLIAVLAHGRSSHISFIIVGMRVV
jgi:hypothetical protein